MDEMALSKLEILIVEDSATQALLLKASLEEKHLHVVVARDGVEALETIQRHRPHLVISDIEMPRMDGYDLCRRIKADPELRNIPVILLTNLSDARDVIRGIESGADSFLTKPFQIDFLISNISDILENLKIRPASSLKQNISFFFRDQKHQLHIDPEQITDLLLSTYSSAMQKNLELEKAYRKLNEAHQDVAKKNKELQQLNTEKNQFLGMAAHDLRNPLSVIQGYSDLLLEKPIKTLDEEAQLMLQRIKRSSASMLNLINDLLNISVIESGEVTLRLKKIDIFKLVKENVLLKVSLAEKKEIALQFICEQSMPEVNCDPEKIDQILNNLITNAIKFSQPHTKVMVSLSLTPTEVVCSVRDEGVGIPAEERDRLFQPFSKTSVKSTAGEPSTGLGLAIVKKIVTEHQGRIWVESEVGKGSTFAFAIPI